MYAGRSRAASASSQRRMSAPRSVVAIAFLLFIVVVDDIAHVGCMSLDRLGASPTELELQQQLADKSPAPPAYNADESVLVDDMELEAVPAGGSGDMFVLVPAGGSVERESVDRNTIESGGAKRQDEVAQEAGDMLMMESNDAPVVEMLVAPPQNALTGDDESDQVKVLAEAQVVPAKKEAENKNDEVEEIKDHKEEIMAGDEARTDTEQNLVLLDKVEQVLPAKQSVEKESAQEAGESEASVADATSEEEKHDGTMQETVEIEQDSESESNADAETSASAAEETQSTNDNEQDNVKEAAEDLERPAQDEREEAIESLTAIEEDMFPEQSVEQTAVNLPLEAATQDQQSEVSSGVNESESSASNEQQNEIEVETVEEEVQPEPATAAEETANAEEAQSAGIDSEAEAEPKPVEHLETIEAQETNKETISVSEEETPAVEAAEAEIPHAAVPQDEIRQEDEDQKADESEIVESNKVEQPHNIEDEESETENVAYEEQKQEVGANQVAAEIEEVKEAEMPNEMLEDKRDEEIQNADEEQHKDEMAEEHVETHETESEELHKEQNEANENEVQPEIEADEKDFVMKEEIKEIQQGHSQPDKQEVAVVEEVETIKPLETLPAMETPNEAPVQENDLVEIALDPIASVAQAEKTEEPAAGSEETKPEVEEQQQQNKEKEEQQQMDENVYKIEDEEAPSAAAVAQAPEPIEPTSILTTIVQVPQQQQQQILQSIQPPQLQYGEQAPAEDEGLPQQSWQQQLLAQQQQQQQHQAALLQSQQQQFLLALQQAQREQQQQQHVQLLAQEPTTPIKFQSVASPAIESATQQSLNVVDSVLNYVNASFMQQNNNNQQQPQQQQPQTSLQDEEQAFNAKLRRYDGAQLWRIVVQSDRDRKLADELQTKYGGQLWKEVKQEVDYLLKPQVLADAALHIRAANLSRIVLIDNLQNAIARENPPADEIALLQNRKGHRLTWQAYHRLADIHGFFDYLAKTYPDICSVETIGYSVEKRPLKILKISNGNAGNPGFWIDGGMHAREWISPASVTYIANQLVEGWDDLPAYMRNINWYIHAVANPDGYEYSHTTDRLWRKNMRSHGRQCPGVDLNRNFGYKWGGKGTSANPCAQTYRGSKAFSEPETFYISKFISNFPRDTFHAYLSFHSYGQYILYPWGYDHHLTADKSDLDSVARQAGTIITKKSGVKYTVGSSATTLYPAAGGSDDWAKGFAGIKYAYTIEMGDTGRYGFVLPASYIETNGKDGYTFVETVARAVTLGKDSRKRAF